MIIYTYQQKTLEVFKMEERIKEIIEKMSTEDKVALWNEYCDSTNRTDDWVYSMEEFDEIMSGRKPWDIVRTCYYGDLNPTHEYFWFNGYANLESDDWIDGEKSPFDIDELVYYIVENEEDFGNDEIAEVLEGEEEEE
jgi:hypothetical protein